MKGWLLILLFGIGLLGNAEKTVVTVSERDAKIFVNGKLVGYGTAKLVVDKGECVNMKVYKQGFLTIEKDYCNKKGYAEPPEKDYIKLEPDEAYTSTVKSDFVNNDVFISATPSIESWRTLNQIIVSYFDIIEVSDKETSYLRTSWVTRSFKSGVIRTRLITKGDPRGYKIKLISEISQNPAASVRDDEMFKETDRILRKYEGLIGEVQARIK
jgi:hypothetical protein